MDHSHWVCDSRAAVRSLRCAQTRVDRNFRTDHIHLSRSCVIVRRHSSCVAREPAAGLWHRDSHWPADAVALGAVPVFQDAGPNSKKITGYVADAYLIIVVVYGFAVPDFASLRNPSDLPASMMIYYLLVVGGLIILLLVGAIKLAWNSRHQAAVVRSRMRVLAIASALLALTLLISIAASGSGSQRSTTVHTITQVITLLSALMFILGLCAPRFIRTVWAHEARAALALAAADVMQMSAAQEITARLLSTMAQTAGSNEAGFVPKQGDPVLVGARPAELSTLLSSDLPRLEYPISTGSVVVWTNGFVAVY